MAYGKYKSLLAYRKQSLQTFAYGEPDGRQTFADDDVLRQRAEAIGLSEAEWQLLADIAGGNPLPVKGRDAGYDKLQSKGLIDNIPGAGSGYRATSSGKMALRATQRMTRFGRTLFSLPTYRESTGWTGGDSRTLYAFRDKRTGKVTVRPGGQADGIGPECDVSIATRAEAEQGWQDPLNKGWKVADSAYGRTLAFDKFKVDDKVRIKGTRKTGFVLRVGDSGPGYTWYYCYINGQTIAVVDSDLERV